MKMTSNSASVKVDQEKLDRLRLNLTLRDGKYYGQIIVELNALLDRRNKELEEELVQKEGGLPS